MAGRTRAAEPIILLHADNKHELTNARRKAVFYQKVQGKNWRVEAKHVRFGTVIKLGTG